MTMMRSIMLFALIAAAAASEKDVVDYHQQQSQTPTNDELLEKLMRLEDRFERELNEANTRQTNQMTKLKKQFDEEMDVAQGKISQLTKKMDEANDRIVRLEDKNDQLTQELSDTRGTIVTLKRDVDQMNNDLMLLLLRQSTLDDKRPAASNNKSIASGVFDAAAVGGERKSKSYLMPRSCAEARSADPTLQSGNYYVDPDGTNVGDDPIYVYCDMSTGTTLVSHDSEATIDVGNCNTPGCYSRAINYAGGATTRQFAALVDLSTSCRQSIRYDCFGAPLEFTGEAQSWWNDRNGAQRYFWAGANTNNNNQHTCQCGIEGNCIDTKLKCNCDAMAFVQVNDNGYVTEKSLLPVTRLNFGRIAAGASGRHTLGKFECSGRVTLATKPTSCHDLFIAGNQISGFYTVKASTTQLKTVYCDFSKAQGTTGYESAIGYLDVKTSSVSFFVQRQTTYNANGTVIPYEVTRLNVGGQMNAATGVFTAPVNGRYHFSFTALSYSSGVNNYVYLRVNGVNNAMTRAQTNIDNLPMVATLQLTKGNTVDVYLYAGSIYDSYNHYTQFSGFLLEEDLVL